ncbi:FAD-dependent oxidoreductase [Streptomyces massasporeus]
MILGSGCSGLFLADELAKRGLRCVLIDASPIAGYSSTKNQGWLQSGSLYAIIGDARAAAECRAGHQFIVERYGAVIHSDIPSYFHFKSEESLQSALSACERDSVPIRRLSRGEILGAVRRNPILQPMEDNPPLWVASGRDRPVDTQFLMMEIGRDVASKGVRYILVEGMETVKAAEIDDGWVISFEGREEELRCRAFVLACGVYMPKMLESMFPEEDQSVKLTKIPVLVLKGKMTPISTASLITPVKDGPNIVPFRKGSEEGVSICLMGDDEAIEDPADHALPSEAWDKYADKLAEHYPGIKRLVQDNAITAHFYVCQKIKADSRGRLLDYRDDWPDGGQRLLVSFYPGKFTSSPISAMDCATEIAGRLGVTSIPPVAEQLYFQRSDHEASYESDRLTFKPMPHADD